MFLLDFALTHVDEVIDELLTKDYSCDIAMPRIKKRYLFCILTSFHCVLFILLFWFVSVGFDHCLCFGLHMRLFFKET